MAKIGIAENSPLAIELHRDDGSPPMVLHRGHVDSAMKDSRTEKLTWREVVISIEKG